jgi:hypothetical protein
LARLLTKVRVDLMGEILDAFLKAFDAEAPTKRCALCGLELPHTDFGYDGRTRDRLTYRCNTCRKMQTKES